MFNRVIERFAHRLMSEYERLGLIPERLDGISTQADQPRLLCQTRAVIFLNIYAKLTNNKRASSYAQQIYKSSHAKFRLNKSELSKIAPYELAFLALAQGHLISQSEKTLQHRLHHEIVDTFTALERIISTETCFTPLNSGNFLELNAAMHIVEALGFLRANGTAQAAPPLSLLAARIIEIFFNRDHYLFSETVSLDTNHYLTYDLGHNFEWISIIKEYDLSDLFNIDPDKLFNRTINLANPQRSIINPLADDHLDLINTEKRIWQSCEYLRASANLNRTDQAYEQLFFECFFLGEEFIEFSHDKAASYKSTTGYHLIECYKKLNF
jgi:hypothetical protein